MAKYVEAPRVGYRRGVDGAIERRRFLTSELPEGWADSPARATATVAAPKPPSEPGPEEAPDGDPKAEAIAEAEALGIDVDGRWGVARIRAAIDAAKGTSEG